MKKAATLLLCLALAAGFAARADEEKPAAKKSQKAKSDKNVFQKAESSTGKFLHDSKIWTRSEPRGTAQKAAEQ